jgi:hypothetical protein
MSSALKWPKVGNGKGYVFLLEDTLMASVVGKNKAQVKEIFSVGRCLRGLIDGKTIFRFAREISQQAKVKRKPGGAWVSEGWFSSNLLDD